ncbi:winged helix-turn-helix transcriptional regulator [Flavitalea flava]
MKKIEEYKQSIIHLRDAIEIISGKWKLIILLVLQHKPFRFKELMREIDISPRMLSKELQELEVNGLITRTVLSTKPISVEYAITNHGKTLNVVTTSIKEWGKKHRQKVLSRFGTP